MELPSLYLGAAPAATAASFQIDAVLGIPPMIAPGGAHRQSHPALNNSSGTAIYPQWDTTYAAQLLRQFSLDVGAQIKTLSKGQRARLGLIAAEAHRPDLLILDEPSSGLDPIVRRDILEAIIRTVTDEGRTVIV